MAKKKEKNTSGEKKSVGRLIIERLTDARVLMIFAFGLVTWLTTAEGTELPPLADMPPGVADLMDRIQKRSAPPPINFDSSQYRLVELQMSIPPAALRDTAAFNDFRRQLFYRALGDARDEIPFPLQLKYYLDDPLDIQVDDYRLGTVIPGFSALAGVYKETIKQPDDTSYQLKLTYYYAVDRYPITPTAIEAMYEKINALIDQGGDIRVYDIQQKVLQNEQLLAEIRQLLATYRKYLQLIESPILIFDTEPQQLDFLRFASASYELDPIDRFAIDILISSYGLDRYDKSGKVRITCIGYTDEEPVDPNRPIIHHRRAPIYWDPDRKGRVFRYGESGPPEAEIGGEILSNEELSYARAWSGIAYVAERLERLRQLHQLPDFELYYEGRGVDESPGRRKEEKRAIFFNIN